MVEAQDLVNVNHVKVLMKLRGLFL